METVNKPKKPKPSNALLEGVIELVLTLVFFVIGALVLALFGVALDGEKVDFDLIILAGIAVFFLVVGIIGGITNGRKKKVPDWYWSSGLHDAQILSVSELELPTDWKAKPPRYNCFEILLDAEGAIYDQSVYKIQLYNYKITTPQVDLSKLGPIWWMGDTLRTLPNGGYTLEIEVADSKNDRHLFSITFQSAQVHRKGQKA